MYRNNLFKMASSLFSSVVEHWSRKPGVVSSNLTGGKFVFMLKVKTIDIVMYYQLENNYFSTNIIFLLETNIKMLKFQKYQRRE